MNQTHQLTYEEGANSYPDALGFMWKIAYYVAQYN